MSAQDIWDSALDAAITTMLVNDPSYIQSMQNPTERQQAYAVANNWELIRHIKNPTHKIKYFAIIKNPKALNYIQDSDQLMHVTAVKQHYQYREWLFKDIEVFKDENYLNCIKLLAGV